MVRTPATKATGIDASSTARPRSPAMRIGRRRRRSTQTPAGRPRRMNGRKAIVPRSATSNGVATSTTIATSGRASCVTCVPTWLTVSAVHSLRKSGWRQRLRRVSAMRPPGRSGTGRAPGRVYTRTASGTAPACHHPRVPHLIESVPNFSEGARLEVVDAIAAAVEATPGAHLFDRTSDASHDRSVLTLAGDADAVQDALEAAIAVAI